MTTSAEQQPSPPFITAAMLSPREGAVSSYVGLRRSVGIIGMSLPLVLPLLTLAVFDEKLPSSVSGYYHTMAGNILVGAMCAIGVFLLSYNFAPLDNWIANIAGVAAIIAGIVPTARFSDANGLEQTASVIHLLSSAILFLMLAFFSLFLFTRTRTDAGGLFTPTKQKQERNIVYRICGLVIVGSLALAVVLGLILDNSTMREFRVIFWLEAISILAFGASWLVKGGWLFRDQPRDDAA